MNTLYNMKTHFFIIIFLFYSAYMIVSIYGKNNNKNPLTENLKNRLMDDSSTKYH